jgi:hypothetical protein
MSQVVAANKIRIRTNVYIKLICIKKLYFVDVTSSSGEQNKDKDKCLYKANIYKTNTLANRMITVIVLREMFLKG